MPRSMKLRLVLPVLIVALAALVVVAGCGGSDDGGSGGTDPASVAPAKAPVFIGFTVRPEGETKQNIEALAQKIAGVDLGELILTELEDEAADEGEEFDYEKEVEPWLGEEGGIFLQDYEEEDFESYGAAIQTTDEDAARDFVNEKIEADKDETAEDGSYDGVDFKVQEDETTIGVFDGLVAFAEDEKTFKAMVDASDGENLAGEEAFTA